jgi:hypothetical protein
MMDGMMDVHTSTVGSNIDILFGRYRELVKCICGDSIK